MRSRIIAVLLMLTSIPVICSVSQAQLAHRKSFLDDQSGPVKITNGPIVESVKGDSAMIAWSTNVKSGSEVRYGAKRNLLNRSETVKPDGKGLMHRVQLKGLEPSKTYFFQVKSRAGAGQASDSSKVLSFSTPALGAEARHNELPTQP